MGSPPARRSMSRVRARASAGRLSRRMSRIKVRLGFGMACDYAQPLPAEPSAFGGADVRCPPADGRPILLFACVGGARAREPPAPPSPLPAARRLATARTPFSRDGVS